MPREVHVFSLSEFTLLPALLSAALGRTVVVIDSNPLLPGCTKLVAMARRWLANSGRTTDIRDLLPATTRFWDCAGDPEIGAVFDWVHTTGREADRFLRYADMAAQAPGYGEAIMSGALSHYGYHAFLIYMLRDLESLDGDVVLRGFDPEIVAFFRARWGRAPNLRMAGSWQPRAVINGLLAVGALARIIGLIARRFRLRPATAEPLFMAVDAHEARRGIALIDGLTEGAPGKIGLVPRNDEIGRALRSDLPDRIIHDRTEGEIGPSDMLGFLALAVRDTARVWRAGRHLHPAIGRAALGLVYWRVVYRSFFRRFQPRFFWCRDDYSPDHHMRSQELRAVGGQSLGLLHGVPLSGAHGSWRFFDFDRYYVYGRDNMDPLVREHWPAHTVIKVVGTWGMTRAEWAALPPLEDRPHDIAVMSSDMPGGVEATAAVRTVAAAFPDRLVYYRPKRQTYPNSPELDRLHRALMTDPPPNVRCPDDRSYAIFGQVRHMLSSPSSVVAEALQLGVNAFCLAVGYEEDRPEPRPLTYKQAPSLCIATVEEFIERVRAIEAGRWRYPRDEAAGIVDISGTSLFDVVRADLGLDIAPSTQGGTSS
jgi:hypothetical protein